MQGPSNGTSAAVYAAPRLLPNTHHRYVCLRYRQHRGYTFPTFFSHPKTVTPTPSAAAAAAAVVQKHVGGLQLTASCHVAQTHAMAERGYYPKGHRSSTLSPSSRSCLVPTHGVTHMEQALS
ncbi:hypothetical protein BJX63DRAFT_118103 [Aspergillus granulosus]|uniref:Uncharacterized protein n=1 Tax=Aspergillus granulosus TaxID=176169 RepID=A0ABR4HR51_9EURO